MTLLELGAGEAFVADHDLAWLKDTFEQFGGDNALRGARLCHLVTTALLVWYAVLTSAGAAVYLGLLVVAGAFAYEHSIVRPGDLSRLDRAFFKVNGFVGIALFAFALLDLLLRGMGA